MQEGVRLQQLSLRFARVCDFSAAQSNAIPSEAKSGESRRCASFTRARQSVRRFARTDNPTLVIGGANAVSVWLAHNF